MRQRSCTASPAMNCDRRLWSCALLSPRRQITCTCNITCNSSHFPDGAQPARARVVAAAGAHSATAATPIREPRGARAPSKLAEELYQYAAASTAVGRRPGNDAFLTACLSDLSAPHRLRRLRPRQLAILLRSLVHLGAHPGEDWLTDLDACCYCHPGPFDPASATAVLQALAALQRNTTPPTTGASSAALSSQAASGAAAIAANDADACTAYWGASATHWTHQSPHHRGLGKAPRSSSASSPTSSFSQQQQQPRRVSQHRGPGHRLTSSPYAASHAASASASLPTSARGGGDSSGSSASPFRFPQAVYLRLLQGGVHNYTYDQLATLLQSFRSLGVPVSDELALQVGSRMAALLLEMGPEQRQRALAAVVGPAGGQVGGAA